MRVREEKTSAESVRMEPRPYIDPTKIAPLFQPRGKYDGKLFHAMDKVTYTFIAEREVVSLHFDSFRRAIFFNGHNIENRPLILKEISYLEQLREVLKEHPEAQSFAPLYTEVLNAYLKEHPVP